MLKNISKIFSPELLKVLMEMGHGDEIVIADGNFPASTNANRLIRYDGHSIPDLLEDILNVFPLDSYSKSQVFFMEVEEQDEQSPVIWDKYQELLDESNEKYTIEYIERHKFYERSKNAYAIVATGEEALYANIILKKGVVQ